MNIINVETIILIDIDSGCYSWFEDIEKLYAGIKSIPESLRTLIPECISKIEQIEYIALTNSLLFSEIRKKARYRPLENDGNRDKRKPWEIENQDWPYHDPEIQFPRNEGDDEKPIFIEQSIIDAAGIYTPSFFSFIKKRIDKDTESAISKATSEMTDGPAVILCPQKIIDFYHQLTIKGNGVLLNQPIPSLNPIWIFLKLVLFHEIGHHVFYSDDDGYDYFSEAMANVFTWFFLDSKEKRVLFSKTSLLQAPLYSGYRVLLNEMSRRRFEELIQVYFHRGAGPAVGIFVRNIVGTIEKKGYQNIDTHPLPVHACYLYALFGLLFEANLVVKFRNQVPLTFNSIPIEIHELLEKNGFNCSFLTPNLRSVFIQRIETLKNLYSNGPCRIFLQSILEQAKQAPELPETVSIEGGVFTFKGNQLSIGSVEIGKYAVTSRQWVDFLNSVDDEELISVYCRLNVESTYQYFEGRYQPKPGQVKHPANNVSLRGAGAYCMWLSERTGRLFSLPSEEQWLLAYNRFSGRIFPWGNKMISNCANFMTNWRSPIETLASVDDFKTGASKSGCVQMAGNVWEWTGSKAGEEFILKGGCYDSDEWEISQEGRLLAGEDETSPEYGFRVSVEVV